MARPYRVSSLWRLYPDQSRIWNRDAYLDNVFLYNVHWVRQALILCLNFTYLLSPLRSLWIIGLLQSLSIPLCVALCFFCLIPSLPNIFKFFQSCFFFQLCSSLLYPHLLFIYDCTITCMQIKFLLTLLVSMLFFFILFLLVSYLLFLHFKKNKYWLCALNSFNCLFLLRHCFSLSSCNCLTN